MANGDSFVGKQVSGYRIIARIGGGSFGNVYQGKHVIFSDEEPLVAIKLLRSQLISEQEQERFIQEARILRRLKHPYILPILGAGIHDDSPYFIVEYAANGTLRDRLKRQSIRSRSLEESVRILSQLGQALQYIHQRENPIVHRDIKPENILFNAHDDALLADFGIAVILESPGTKPADAIGSLPYMAPEQFEEVASPKGDQYALGCVAYELFTGQRPFNVTPASNWVGWWYKHTKEDPISPRQLNPDLPSYIEKAILKAMAKRREDRYPDVAAFIAALSKSKEEWLREGYAHYDAGRDSEALATFEQVIRLEPGSFDGYYGKATVLYYHLKEREDAIIVYDQAIPLRPDFAPAYIDKGQALNELGRHKEALAACDYAIKQLSYKEAWAYNNKTRALNALGRHTEALAVCEEAIGLDATYANLHNNKAWALNALGRYSEGLAASEEAIRLAPDFAPAHNSRSWALQGLGRYEEALVAGEDAIHFDPNFANAYNSKGWALNSLKRHEEALTAFEKAIHLNPDFIAAYEGKGLALYHLNRNGEAIKAYQQAIDLGSRSPGPRAVMGLALCRLKRYEEALKACEEAIQLDKFTTDAYLGKGNALFGLERYEEALSAYDEVIKRAPGYKEAYTGKANAYEGLARQYRKKADELEKNK